LHSEPGSESEDGEEEGGEEVDVEEDATPEPAKPPSVEDWLMGVQSASVTGSESSSE
jgi:hypothetical protein